MLEHHTNQANFKVFIEECRYWIEKYGLKSWHWNFHHADQDCFNNTSRASYCYSRESRIASIYLHENWGEDIPNEYNIRVAAYHEIWEILIAMLSSVAMARSFREEDLETAQHELIRTVENAHFPERARSLGISDGKIGEIVRSETEKVRRTKPGK